MADDIYHSEVVADEVAGWRAPGESLPQMYSFERSDEYFAGRIGKRFRPDHEKTKGAFWREVSVETLSEPGYTARVRDVPMSLKRNVMDNYGLKMETISNYEIDHLISLELGGSNAIENLWPEPYDGLWNARVKDKLENRLHWLVMHHQVSLRTAQKEIATDWIAAYKKYLGDSP